MIDRSLFPHQNLDYSISELERNSQQVSGNMGTLVNLIKSYISLGFFHGGGERPCSQALQQGRRILAEDPTHLDTLSLMALASMRTNQTSLAQKFLQNAQNLQQPNVYLYLALGFFYKMQQQHSQAIENWKKAIDLAPRAWEIHLWLGSLYLQQQKDLSLDESYRKRVAQQSLYHMIQALESNVDLEVEVAFLQNIGEACLVNGYFKEAEKYFNRLRQSKIHQSLASYYIGLVAFELGKYNNAAQHFRIFLADFPDRVDVVAKQAQCLFLRGEFPKAKQVCYQGLQMDQFHLETRLILGRCYLAEGQYAEANRIFMETLKEEPQHLESFAEIVNMRCQAGEKEWLEGALYQEVANYGAMSSTTSDLAQLVRQRIGVILQALMELGEELIPVVLHSIVHTQDENLRYALWEVATAMTEQYFAMQSIEELEDAARNYSLKLGGWVLSTAKYIPEEYLYQGLNITDADFKRAVSERYPPAYDVSQYQKNEEKERQIARAYQALLLLSIASHSSEVAQKLLLEWTEKGDADMSIAAKVGLAIQGSEKAFKDLGGLTHTSTRKQLLARMHRSLGHVAVKNHPEFVFSDTQICELCSQSGRAIHHFILNKTGGICNHCIVDSQKSPLAGADAICVFCNNSLFQTRRIVLHKDKEICASCQNQSQMMVEKDLIQNFFVAQFYSSQS